jgi:hypothetical protein
MLLEVELLEDPVDYVVTNAYCKFKSGNLCYDNCSIVIINSNDLDLLSWKFWLVHGQVDYGVLWQACCLSGR